jgi:hypothetical protein
MAMDASKFEAIKNKARKMIHEDAKSDSHIIKERQMDREKTYRSLKGSSAPAITGFENIAPSYGSNGTSINSINESYTDDSEDRLGAAMNDTMKKFMENRQTGQQIPVAQQMPSQVNKNLPKEILESFSNNYIDQSVFDPHRSVLDKMGIAGDNEQPMQENYVPHQQQSSVGKVDYELIKSIVESSVKKYVNALGKKMLTENNSVTNLDEINAIQITDKKIAIVTKNGNLFEGKLEFKKNIKSGS